MSTVTSPHISPADLAALAEPVYGPRWQSALARDMSVAVRTVQRWARDGVDRPATAESVRRFLEERRRLTIAPPPEGEDRDDAAYDEMRPRVDALVSAAEAAGWHPAEVLSGLLAVTVEKMRDGAGTSATIETLKSAIASLRAARDT